MAVAGSPEPRADDSTIAIPEVPTRADGEGQERALSRRHVLCAAALAGVGFPLVAACGGSNNSSDSASSAGSSGTTTSSGTGGTSGAGGQGGGGGGNSAGGGGAGGAPITTTNKVPKGGGVILPQDGVVITQPKPGEFKGFSSTCTHAGCTLHDVTHGTINCICHGSQFSIKNGSVVSGPAPLPLPKVPIKIQGKDITLV